MRRSAIHTAFVLSIVAFSSNTFAGDDGPGRPNPGDPKPACGTGGACPHDPNNPTSSSPGQPPAKPPISPPPVAGPPGISTDPPCTWSIEKNGAYTCQADRVQSIQNLNTLTCNIGFAGSAVRYERLSVTVSPKDPNGDHFAIYGISALPTEVAVDSQNEILTTTSPIGPRPVTGGYVCHFDLTLWFMDLPKRK